jgi:hypothetical protein
MTWTAIDEYRAIARQRFYHRCTPFRLGLVVGEAGDDRALCPYESAHSIALFNQGYDAGQEDRKRQQERQDEANLPPGGQT